MAAIRRRLEELFPVLKRVPKVLGEKAGLTRETFTAQQKVLAQKFRAGISSALGVPPEAIRQEIVERWLREWTLAFVKPEYIAGEKAMVILPSEFEMERLGRELGMLMRELVR